MFFVRVRAAQGRNDGMGAKSRPFCYSTIQRVGGPCMPALQGFQSCYSERRALDGVSYFIDALLVLVVEQVIVRESRYVEGQVEHLGLQAAVEQNAHAGADDAAAYTTANSSSRVSDAGTTVPMRPPAAAPACPPEIANTAETPIRDISVRVCTT